MKFRSVLNKPDKRQVWGQVCQKSTPSSLLNQGRQTKGFLWLISLSGQDLSCLVPIWMNSRARWLNVENAEYWKEWILICWDTRDTIKVILWMEIYLMMMMRFHLTFCTSGVRLQYSNIAIFEHCTAQVQQMRVFNAQLEKEIRAEKKKNRKMLEKVDICI